jgi:hypothetical protein
LLPAAAEQVPLARFERSPVARGIAFSGAAVRTWGCYGD